MLFEYAVEPKAIGSSWQNFRYLIEKFGFDRGRLISQFPKVWFKEVYKASADLKPMERKRIEESLNSAKQSKFLRSGRPYDPALGGWVANALAQQGVAPFHAIIAQDNVGGDPCIIVAEDAHELDPLMVSPHTWEVQRTGTALANAMGPLLRSSRRLLFIDRYFNVREERYKQTLRACLAHAYLSGIKGTRCEVHFCDHESRPPIEVLERDAPGWLKGVIPDGMSVVLYAWKEKPGGGDFHARYLLTDVGGVGVEAGFSAEGAHQSVQLALLSADFAQSQLAVFAQTSTVYDLAHPILEISADGAVKRI